MNLSAQYTNNLTTQSYDSSPEIEGLELKKLTYHADDGGNFAEIFRLSNGQVENVSAPFEARQVSMSLLVPKTIKAYHVHKKQDDIWFVPPTNRLLVNLHDLREDSSTYNTHKRFVLGAGSASILRIPAGVAHGVANIYNQDMLLFYATSEQFSKENPDEHRLAWDSFGADVWELTKG
jgi:dTDP-4-dehydrorhamnose 3,5-epimerase